ncbi:MAG: translation initiation factor IF-2, partial [Bdellovibrionota bacterium]
KAAVKKTATKAAAAAPEKKAAAKAPAKAKAAAPTKAAAGKTAAKAVPAKAAVAAAPATAKATVVRRKTKETEEADAAKLKARQVAEEPQVEEAPAPVVKKAKVQEEEAPAPAPEKKKAAPVEAPAEVEAADVVEEAAPVAAAPTQVATPAAQAPAQNAAPTPGPGTPARKREVVMSGPGAAPRRNIIGRMDLGRVQTGTGGQQSQTTGQRPVPQPGGPTRGPGFGAGAGGAAGGPARTGPRNIRPGFVSVAPQMPQQMPDFDQSTNRKRFDGTKRKPAEPASAATPGKDEPVEQFNAVEFRKREMVFQPKKKKEFLNRQALQTSITQPKASKRVLKVNGSMKVSDAAQEMGLKAAQFVKVLMKNGVQASMNSDLDFDTLSLIVPEFGWEAQNIFQTAEEMLTENAFGNLDAARIERPPVVTVMGHVDHGKTSLLDSIRKAKVAAGEAGGITQHIGAYSVTLDNGKVVTFLDTPGHEAFTAMRARGANATDIAVIVVAADDGMMPQTAEAVNHAKAAGVPIIVAINKMDKQGANPEKIKQQLTELELVPEEWGGTTIYAPVSAMKGTGINELLEQILLVAEVQELRANPERSGTGLVIEAKIEKGKGPVATLLIKDGTVKVGQYIVAGTKKGRIRSLMNDRGERVQEMGPGYPVEVQGLEETPFAGDQFDIVESESTANDAVETRVAKALAEKKASQTKLTLEDIFSKVNKGDVKDLNIILKADVQGSAEAIRGMLTKASTQEVKIKIIHSAIGGVTESDVLLAQTSKAIIIGFGVRPDASAAAKAKQIGVDIRTYTIVYEMIDEIKKAMTGLLTPDVVEKVVGQVEVRNIFSVPKIGVIAGCFVTEGKVLRSNMIRLVRDGKIVYEGKISSLKRFKDDAREVASGFECGIGIENFNDIKVGDRMEAYIKEEVARALTPMETST